MDPLSTMYTMHGPGRQLTRTEKILAIQKAREVALATFRMEAFTHSNYQANEAIRELKALDGVMQVSWRATFESIKRKRIHHRRNDLSGGASPEERAKNTEALLALNKLEVVLEAAIDLFDSLVNDLLIEHDIRG